ncbi:hypothetical protein FAES_3992 [Fibrella aestuarina BUZ 2]|uniref:Tape measure protein N-terminal domain-containing protein n=1 Tax=Fibrella aestuarina BUZ 2 TaxID=1166018 RepID=I0KCZ0_9BACT|nr:tape measure protein [Fibrella aestuarina]CCH01993.1 hypothetical protein FAES_3992 [Fibrella aestuarina BUZ 2]
MNEAAQLSVGIDGNLSGFERVINRAVSLLNQFVGLGDRAGSRFDSGFGNAAARTAGRVTQSIEGLKLKLDQLTLKRDLSIDSSTIVKLNREIDQTRTKINQLKGLGMELPQPSTGAISSLTSYASGMVGIGTAIAIARKGFTAMVEFDQMDRKLQGVATSQADYANSMAFTDRIADRYGLNIQKLADSYAGLKAASEGTTLAGRQTDAIFEAVTARSAKMGLSTQRTEKALLALTQMLSKGRITAEEMTNQLAEAVPGATQILARALGVTTAKLGEMMQKGELAATTVLPKFAAELAKTAEGAEKNANSMAGGFNRLQNQIFLLIGEFSKTAGIDSFFGKMTGGLADMLRGVRQLVADRSWGELFRIASNPFMLIGNPGLNKAQQKAAKIDAFGGLSPTAQLNEITRASQQKKQLEASVARQQAANLGGSLFPSAQLSQDIASLKEVSDYLGTIYKLAVDTQKVEVQNRRAAANLPKPVVGYAEDFKTKEKEYDALLDKQKGLRSVSKELTKEEQARLSVLKQQLALGDKKKYGDKETKVKSESISRLGSVAAMEAMLKREEDKLFTAIQNGTADKPLAGQDWQGTTQRQRTEALRKSLKEAKEEVKELRKELDFLDKLTGLNITGSGGLTRGDREKDPNTPRLATPLGTLENGKRGVNTEAYELKAEQTNEVLRRYEESRTRFKKLPGFLQDIFKSVSVGARALDQEVTAGTDAANDVLRQKANDFSNLLEGMAQLGTDFAQSALPQVGNQFFSGLADSINQGNDEPLKKALQGIKDMLSEYLIQLGTSLTITGGLELLGAAVPGLQALALTGGQKMAVGGAMLAGGIALKAAGPSRKSKGYATGGHVLGEGSETSDSIPAWLSNGEFVVKADAVRKVGVPFLNSLNQGKRLPTSSRLNASQIQYDVRNSMGSALNTNHLKAAMPGGNSTGNDTFKFKSTTRIRSGDLYYSIQSDELDRKSFGRDL